MTLIQLIRYDKRMDAECIPLCDAMNSIKGIRTVESCCGHGKTSFDVWFKLDKKYFENLHIIARITCIRYGGFSNWTCTPYCDDIYKSNKLTFELSSGIAKGKKAYDQADKMVENIHYHLNHKAYKKYFKIKE